MNVESPAGPADENEGHPQTPSPSQLRNMSVKELTAILRSLSEDYSDCIDRESLVERAIQATSSSRSRRD